MLLIVANHFDDMIKWIEVHERGERRGRGEYRIRCTATLKLGMPGPSWPLPLLQAPAEGLGSSVPGGPPS